MTALINASNMEEHCREVIYCAFASHCAGLLQLTVLRRTRRELARSLSLWERKLKVPTQHHSGKQRRDTWLLRDAQDRERREEKEGG
jgi:hypothetical protein